MRVAHAGRDPRRDEQEPRAGGAHPPPLRHPGAPAVPGQVRACVGFASVWTPRRAGAQQPGVSAVQGKHTKSSAWGELSAWRTARHRWQRGVRDEEGASATSEVGVVARARACAGKCSPRRRRRRAGPASRCRRCCRSSAARPAPRGEPAFSTNARPLMRSTPRATLRGGSFSWLEQLRSSMWGPTCVLTAPWTPLRLLRCHLAAGGPDPSWESTRTRCCGRSWATRRKGSRSFGPRAPSDRCSSSLRDSALGPASRGLAVVAGRLCIEMQVGRETRPAAVH